MKSRDQPETGQLGSKQFWIIMEIIHILLHTGTKGPITGHFNWKDLKIRKKFIRKK